MLADLGKPLTDAQKKKGEILLEECPKALLRQWKAPEKVRTVGDMLNIMEVFELHLQDIDAEKTNRIYKRLAWVDEVYNDVH